MISKSVSAPARSVRQFVAVLFVLIVTSATTFYPGHALGRDQIKIDAALEGSHSSGFSIKFRIENISSVSIKIQRRYLPWTQSQSSGLVISAFSRQQMGQALAVGRSMHNPTGEVTLQQGQSVEGSLELNRVIPDLREALRNSDVVVHWTYFPDFGGNKM